MDPFHGRQDIEQRTLRAVTDAFAEDPLRVFRVARFAATLPGFSVHPHTLEMMRAMSAEGLLDELSAERVWVEFAKALAGAAPERFVATVCDADALSPWFAWLPASV